MINRSSSNSTHPSCDINVMSAAEACAKFDGFFKTPSLTINPLQFGSDVSNKLFDVPKTQSMIDIESLSSDIRHQLFQVPVMLCEIQNLQNCLGINNNEIAADTSLSQKRDMRDKLSNQLCVNLITLMESKEIRNISHPKSKKNLDELLYEIALTLATLNPVNDIDFATQDPIEPENRIVTSDRYQHDINSLQQWLRHKSTNPWTNLKFSRRDINFIEVNFKARKPNDPIVINAGNPYPGGDPDLEATTALVRRLTESAPTRGNADFEQEYYQTRNIPHLRTRPSGAMHREEQLRDLARRLTTYYIFEDDDYHHEVIPMTNHSTLGFFRQQPNEAGRREISDIATEIQLELPLPAPGSRLLPYSRHYGVISVGDIPSFNEPRDTTPRYWPTDIHQSVPQHSETAAPSIEDLSNAKKFKDKLAFFIDHHNEWPISEAVNHIMTELLPAYSSAPIQLQRIHDMLTHKIIDRRSMSFFHYMPDPSEFRDYIENQRRSHRWSALYTSERERRMGRAVAEYAGKLTVVICVIDGYLAHHARITASGNIDMHIEAPATEEGRSDDVSNVHEAISHQNSRRTF